MGFFDTGRFRFQAALWKFFYDEVGDVMVQICPRGMEFAPLKVTRSQDWGWHLMSTGRLADMVHFLSRQLTPAEHFVAADIPPEIVTLYLCRSQDESHPSMLYGVWQ